MKKLFFCLIILIVQGFSQINEQNKNTICLNMIVKDEAHVIKRCLDSVKHLIDYWVIFDTGSTDGTQQVIKDYLKDIPGELHERPWVDFAHNRNEALRAADKKSTYLLIIDADETLHLPQDFDKDKLYKDCYYATVKQDLASCPRIFLVKTTTYWYWEGVLHERICCKEAVDYEILKDSIIIAIEDGNRSKDPKKYEKDVLVLEQALKKEPNNTRYMFYLAQSYLQIKDKESALKYYSKRAAIKEGERGDIFFSLFMKAALELELKRPEKEFIHSFCEASKFFPKRQEPLFHLAYHFFTQKKYALSYLILKHVNSLPPIDDFGHVQYWVYDYGVKWHLANSAYMMGKLSEAIELYTQVLQMQNLPKEIIRGISQNLLNSKVLSLKNQPISKFTAKRFF